MPGKALKARAIPVLQLRAWVAWAPSLANGRLLPACLGKTSFEEPDTFFAQGLNNCVCNRGIVGEDIRCLIFKADEERRLVYSVITKHDIRRC